MSQLTDYLRTLGQEIVRTERVIDAFPGDQMLFSPHERSSTAQKLIWTFAIEARLVYFSALSGDGRGKSFVAPPDSWDELVAGVKENHRMLIDFLKDKTEAELSPTIKFYVGPGKVGDIPTMDFLWLMLHDHIHHRGQLSVYLRLAGGRVPSIYGPSADEQWT